MTKDSERLKSGSLLPHQDELLYLSELAGVYMSPHIFRFELSQGILKLY